MKSGISIVAVCLAVLSSSAVSPLTSCAPAADSIAPAAPASAAVSNPAVSDNNSRPQSQTQVDSTGEEAVDQLLRSEDYDRAIAEARAALANTTTPAESQKEKLADAYIARAWFYKNKRLNTYSLADLFSATETAPEYYRAHYEIGRFHNNQWQFSIGLLDLNKAIALKPDFAPAYSERAYSYFKNQKYDLALADANKAIQAGPPDAPSYYNRGLIYAATGKPGLAIADFETVLRLSQDGLLSTRASDELKKLGK